VVTSTPDEPGSWSNAALHARMHDQRVVLLTGELDDETAGHLAAELMTLDATGDESVRMLVNSAGGGLQAAFMLIDVIDLLGVPVHATCIGRAEGAPLGVLAVATRRAAAPHARFRWSEPPSAFAGRADDVASWAAQHASDVARFSERVADATRRPAAWIADAMRDGRFFDAREAIRIGLIDEVAQTGAASVEPIDRRPIGFRSRRSSTHNSS
jgi:ATP-dependent Clp protease, protease subunit